MAALYDYDITRFEVKADQFVAAMEELQRATGLDMRDIWRSEVQTVLRRLIRFEYRAKRTAIREQLLDRVVIVWDSGGVFNVPKEEKEKFATAPKGASRGYRARRGRKIVPDEPRMVTSYVDREGYLASGWGAAATHMGIVPPGFVLRHRIDETGGFRDDINNPAGPGFYMVNRANPRDGSKQKLEATLNIQAKAIERSVLAGVDRAFARVRPVATN